MTKSELEAKCAELEKRLDAFKHALAVAIKGEHAEECDCLDHMRDAEKLLSDFKSFDSYIENLCVVSELRSKLAAKTQEADSPRRRWEREVVEAAKAWSLTVSGLPRDHLIPEARAMCDKLAEEPKQ